MLTVELKDVSGQVPVQFDILPTSALPESVAQSQFELAKLLATAIGLQYYFLVTTDRIRGWRLSDGTKFFDEPTVSMLEPYAGSTEPILRARAAYLAALTQAWAADLASHWKSLKGPAPGERELGPEVLEVIRGAERRRSRAS